jgi:hypothetical protein
MAESSLEETRYFLILARDLGYGDKAPSMAALEEVSGQRLQHRHSGFLIFWLLTSISQRDIKGEALG